ncbi:GlxA family transcriptional regulator [Gilvimarinus sp. F26214L]|uniref:GlxA family transcriptional regulator n=1 Tax=Gilvimarinus sp. DZF01 TaxID=3461371 RepID=UPI004045505E
MGRAKRIAVLVYEDCLATEVFSLCDLFLKANGPDAGAPLFETELISATGGRVRAAGGFPLSSVQPSQPCDLLVIPGFEFASRDALSRRLQGLLGEARLIKKLSDSGSELAGIGLGAMVLAEAGMLDGCHVAADWLHAPLLAERYPSVKVDADTVVLDVGGIITTGSPTGAVDLVIHYLCKVGEGERAARIAGIPPGNGTLDCRAPVHKATIESVPGEKGFSERVREWLKQRCQQAYDAEALARAFQVSERTLLRRFQAETGLCPRTYLQSYRMHLARHLLRTSPWSVAEISARIGCTDTAEFCALFRREVHLSPEEYRHRFSSPFQVRREEGDPRLAPLDPLPS